MALSQRLEIRQGHALVMTPQLMQAIKLLQLSNLDLAAYVENELEHNPLLERTDEGADEGERRSLDEASQPHGGPVAGWGGGADSNGAAATDGPGLDLGDVPSEHDDAVVPRANADAPEP